MPHNFWFMRGTFKGKMHQNTNHPNVGTTNENNDILDIEDSESSDVGILSSGFKQMKHQIMYKIMKHYVLQCI